MDGALLLVLDWEGSAWEWLVTGWTVLPPTSRSPLPPASLGLGLSQTAVFALGLWASLTLSCLSGPATTRRLLGRLFWLGVTSDSEGEVKGAGVGSVLSGHLRVRGEATVQKQVQVGAANIRSLGTHRVSPVFRVLGWGSVGVQL